MPKGALEQGLLHLAQLGLSQLGRTTCSLRLSQALGCPTLASGGVIRNLSLGTREDYVGPVVPVTNAVWEGTRI
jgi:hypothetical protein